MGDLIGEMARSSLIRCERARKERSIEQVKQAGDGWTPIPLVLSGRFDLIAECKLRAPSSGALQKPDDPEAAAQVRAAGYASGGAAAISVLTEPSRFDGHLDHLLAVRRKLPDTPAMRKDFLVDAFQVWEARASGASGVLLIVRMLEDRILHEMLDAARDAGLFVLLEAFDLPDVGRVPKRDDVQLLVGVNCRDLSSLEVRYERFARLAEHLPVGLPWVAESGMSEPQQIAEVARLGYRLALVGSALMRDEDPPGLVRRMLEAGRSACG